MKLVIENLEKKLSEWLFLEYRHAAEIWGGALFTNVPGEMAPRLRRYGEVEPRPCYEVIPGEAAVVLDPRGKKRLRKRDFQGREAVVVGGILGEAEPLGRTWEYITSRMRGARVRNLGRIQLTIDSAALVAKLVEMGIPLGDIQVTAEVEVVVSDVESIHLPYGYVILDGRLILTPGLREYLLREHRR